MSLLYIKKVMQGSLTQCLRLLKITSTSQSEKGSDEEATQVESPEEREERDRETERHSQEKNLFFL